VVEPRSWSTINRSARHQESSPAPSQISNSALTKPSKLAYPARLGGGKLRSARERRRRRGRARWRGSLWITRRQKRSRCQAVPPALLRLQAGLALGGAMMATGGNQRSFFRNAWRVGEGRKRGTSNALFSRERPSNHTVYCCWERASACAPRPTPTQALDWTMMYEVNWCGIYYVPIWINRVLKVELAA